MQEKGGVCASVLIRKQCVSLWWGSDSQLLPLLKRGNLRLSRYQSSQNGPKERRAEKRRGSPCLKESQK